MYQELIKLFLFSVSHQHVMMCNESKRRQAYRLCQYDLKTLILKMLKKRNCVMKVPVMQHRFINNLLKLFFFLFKKAQKQCLTYMTCIVLYIVKLMNKIFFCFCFFQYQLKKKNETVAAIKILLHKNAHEMCFLFKADKVHDHLIAPIVALVTITVGHACVDVLKLCQHF